MIYSNQKRWWRIASIEIPLSLWLYVIIIVQINRNGWGQIKSTHFIERERKTCEKCASIFLGVESCLFNSVIEEFLKEAAPVFNSEKTSAKAKGPIYLRVKRRHFVVQVGTLKTAHN